MRLISISARKLLLSGCTYGASVCAAAAAYASVSVDNVLVIALGDAAGGASISASAARDAIIRNLVCHYTIPPLECSIV